MFILILKRFLWKQIVLNIFLLNSVEIFQVKIVSMQLITVISNARSTSTHLWISIWFNPLKTFHFAQSERWNKPQIQFLPLKVRLLIQLWKNIPFVANSIYILIKNFTCMMRVTRKFNWKMINKSRITFVFREFTVYCTEFIPKLYWHIQNCFNSCNCCELARQKKLAVS